MDGLKKVFVLFALFILAVYPTVFAQTSTGNNKPGNQDSAFIKDNPVLERLDSLAASKFFINSHFTTDVSVLNIYNFPKDSIPVYSDSVYRERIAKLNLRSPFEFVYNDQVKPWLEAYAYKKRKLTSRMLGLAELYFPYFEEQLALYDIPLEMKYLAIIESALDPTAKSRAGAGGLWQFLVSTGKMYNLEVSSYVDERFDPYISTVAACKCLRDLYSIYNDWALVLAAYNAGPGTINRAIRTAALDSGSVITYWKIMKYLPTETQNYVPAFIAATYIMTYPAEHNIYPTAPDFMDCQVDTVSVKTSLTFGQIAGYLCIPYTSIEFLNPAYKKGVIPGSPEKPYLLRLPREYMADFINNQENIAKYQSPEELERLEAMKAAANSQQVVKQNNVVKTNGSGNPGAGNKTSVNYSKYITYTVKSGDTLWGIARKYNGTVDEIRRLNNLSNDHMLQPGQKLKIGIKG